MYFLVAAAMCTVGCVGAWLLRDRPLPGEIGTAANVVLGAAELLR